jgi:RNA polymerase sigma-70 factor, ECF subfamily
MQCEPLSLPPGSPVPAGGHRAVARLAPAHGVLVQGRVLELVTTEPESEDAELVRRCRAGDGKAFELLFRRHAGQVAGLVHRMVGPSAELEDLVQEVFLQVIRSLAGFRDEARFSTWLYRVAVNVVLMHRRAQGRRPRLVDEEKAPPQADSSPLAESALETSLRVQAFYRLLTRLSDKKRTVFVLHELEGLTPARIGEIVGAPVLTVRTRLFYARRELLSWLEEEPELATVLAELQGTESEEQGTASEHGSSSPPDEPPRLSKARMSKEVQ